MPKMKAAEKKELGVWIGHAQEAFWKTLKRIAIRRGWASQGNWKDLEEVGSKEVFKAAKASTLASKLAEVFEVLE